MKFSGQRDTMLKKRQSRFKRDVCSPDSNFIVGYETKAIRKIFGLQLTNCFYIFFLGYNFDFIARRHIPITIIYK